MWARLARTGSVARSWGASACVVSHQTLTGRSGEVTQASSAWSAWSPSAAPARVAATFAVHCGEMADSAAGSTSAKAVPARPAASERRRTRWSWSVASQLANASTSASPAHRSGVRSAGVSRRDRAVTSHASAKSTTREMPAAVMTGACLTACSAAACRAVRRGLPGGGQDGAAVRSRWTGT